MADRQRSFADMFPDLMGSLTQGAQWKRGMTPLSEKEMTLSKERALTQEQRKWKKDQMMKEWLYFGPHGLGGEAGREPPISSQVLDYASMWPGNVARKGTQRFIWDKLVPDKIKKRIKRHMKEMSETRKPADYNFEESFHLPSVEQLERHEQVSNRMGYNPTDKRVGEPRSASDHSMDLAGRFLEFLRDKDARAGDIRPDPDIDPRNVESYVRWVADRGQRAAERRESGLPPIRDDSERFAQADTAMFNRNRVLQEAKSKMIESSKDRSFGGLDDLMGRVFGRRKSTDLPYTNR